MLPSDTIFGICLIKGRIYKRIYHDQVYIDETKPIFETNPCKPSRIEHIGAKGGVSKGISSAKCLSPHNSIRARQLADCATPLKRISFVSLMGEPVQISHFPITVLGQDSRRWKKYASADLELPIDDKGVGPLASGFVPVTDVRVT